MDGKMLMLAPGGGLVIGYAKDGSSHGNQF